jgi:FkbM family methyltransferase
MKKNRIIITGADGALGRTVINLLNKNDEFLPLVKHNKKQIKNSIKCNIRNFNSVNKINNVKIFNKAVSDKNGMVTMYYDNKDHAAHSLIHKQNKEIKIESITLEKIFEMENVKICDYLKLDCEGSEFMILENLSTNYFRKIKKILLEYHLFNDEIQLDKLKNRLIEEGFKLEVFPTNSKMGMLFAKKE